MSVFAALVLVASGALACASWLAARLIANVAYRHRATAARAWRRLGARQACWAAFAATATGVGVAAGYPFAGVVLLGPAIAVDHLFLRLGGGSKPSSAAAAQVAGTVGEDAGDEALRDAWRQASLIGVDASVVDIARERCERLMEAHRLEPFELATLEWVVFLRRGVPDLVAAGRDALHLREDGSSSADLVGQIAETLEKIGCEAQRRCGAGCAVAHRRFEFARDHALGRVSEAQS